MAMVINVSIPTNDDDTRVCFVVFASNQALASKSTVSDVPALFGIEMQFGGRVSGFV